MILDPVLLASKNHKITFTLAEIRTAYVRVHGDSKWEFVWNALAKLITKKARISRK
jgi:hypothetical protein